MDIEEKREDQRREAIKQKELMNGLLKNPGWVFLVSVAKLQIEARRNEINFKPTTDVNMDNFLKGECCGIQTIISVPQKVLDGAKEALDILKKETE